MALERLSQVTQSGIVTGIVLSNASVTGVLTATNELKVGSGLTITSTSNTTTVTSDNLTITGNSTINGNSFVDGSLGIGTDSVSLNTLSVGTNPRGYTSYALIHNPSGVGATTKSELSDNAALIIQPHATNSTHMAFGEVNGGAGMGIQVTNYAKNADWDICLNPFGGNVGVGTSVPQSKLDVAGEVRASGIAITTSYPTIKPSLNLDFSNSRSLDSRITFTRASNATYVGRDGLIKTAVDDEPRFDHDPTTGESLGLLIEASRTNFRSNSTQIETQRQILGTWTESLNTSETLAPDGSSTADKLTHSSGNVYRLSWSAGAADGSVSKTFSAYFKGVSGGETLSIDIGDTSNTDFTLTTNWQRLSVTTSSLGSGNFVDFSSLGNSFYVWGAQVEAGSFATSYIPTSGSTVTRAADNTSITGTSFSDWYNPYESTISCSYSHIMSTFPIATGNERAYRFEATSGSDSRIDYVTYNAYHPYISADGSQVANLSGFTGLYNNQKNKTIVSVKKDDFIVASNGEIKASDTSGNWPPTNTINQLYIGSSSVNHLNGHIQKFAYYPKRLPNAQLIALTS